MNRRRLEEDDEIVGTAHLPAEPASVGAARGLVRRRCSGLSSNILDAAELLTSELVTNAIVHAGSAITVKVVRSATLLRISVADSGPGEPTLNASQSDVEGGRGLSIVRDLSSSWGVDRDEAGKV